MGTTDSEESAKSAETLLNVIGDLRITCPASYLADSKVVICGEAPGSEEVRERRGFIGPAGRVFQKACGIAKLDWSKISLTNVAKRQPPGNKFKEDFYEVINEPIYTPKGNLSRKTKKISRKTEELLQYETLLAGELREHNPNLIIAAGNEALETIAGISGITNYRGSIVESQGQFHRPNGDLFKVLAVEHPSYILRGNLADFWILAYDMQKAGREMEFPEIRRESYEEIIRPAKDQIFDSLGYIRNSGRIWTLDVETRAGTLACFGVGWRGAGENLTGLCIPIHTTSGAYWSPEDELEIWRALHETCRGNPYLCNQNIEYDIYYLLRYGVEPSGVWMDTMLAHSLLHPEFPKSLAFLCSFYLDDVVYYKGDGKDDDSRNWSARTTDEDLWRYNIKDDVHTLRVVEKIDEALKRRGLYELYHGEQSRSNSKRNDGDAAEAKSAKL